MREIIFFVILGVGLLAFGWLSHDIYTEWNNKKTIEGLWFNNYNYSIVQQKAYEMDDSGQWVCVNIDKTMDYNDCVRIASHECGHELWSTICGNDPKLCLEGQELINNYQNKS